MVKIALWIAANALGLLALAALHWFLHRRADRPAAGDGRTPAQVREDQLFIWTEVHGIPRERAEAMYESYERAATAASLGLKGK